MCLIHLEALTDVVFLDVDVFVDPAQLRLEDLKLLSEGLILQLVRVSKLTGLAFVSLS